MKALPFAFTQNQQYDRLTRQVIRKVCKPHSNCLDVGCHKGEILDLFLKYAPQGKHYGFEPIPLFFNALQDKYTQTNCVISDLALSDKKGKTSFNYVITNPSYSGLLKRQYDRPNEEDQLILVETERLDAFLPPDFQVDMIKIDVEGGEWLVFQGAVETLKRWKPVVIFEHGLGASEIYGATPEMLYDLLESCGMSVNLLDRFMQAEPPLDKQGFADQYYQKRNYYFIAYPIANF